MKKNGCRKIWVAVLSVMAVAVLLSVAAHYLGQMMVLNISPLENAKEKYFMEHHIRPEKVDKNKPHYPLWEPSMKAGGVSCWICGRRKSAGLDSKYQNHEDARDAEYHLGYDSHFYHAAKVLDDSEFEYIPKK